MKGNQEPMVHQKDTSQEVAGYFLLLFSGEAMRGRRGKR